MLFISVKLFYKNTFQNVAMNFFTHALIIQVIIWAVWVRTTYWNMCEEHKHMYLHTKLGFLKWVIFICSHESNRNFKKNKKRNWVAIDWFLRCCLKLVICITAVITENELYINIYNDIIFYLRFSTRNVGEGTPHMTMTVGIKANLSG